MKFEVSSKAMATTLAAIQRVINSKNTMTILNSVLIEVTPEELIITGSDVDSNLTGRVPLMNLEGEPVKFCIDAKRAVEIFRELPEASVIFELGDNREVVLTYPGGTFNFVAIDGDEYPETRDMAVVADGVSIKMPGEELLWGLDNTAFAVGTDALRPMMMGVYFDIKEDNLTFAATDTRQLVRAINRNIKPGVTYSCIVPIKAVNIVRSSFAKDKEVEVTVDPKSATFSNGQFSFTCLLIKGNFPAYERVIPQTNPYHLTVERISMLNALRRVAVFVDADHGLVKFHISPDILEMKAQDTQLLSQGRESVPCTFTGEDLVMGFSCPYLINMFSTLSSENVLAHLADPSRPGVFEPDNNSEEHHLTMLLMPMNVVQY